MARLETRSQKLEKMVKYLLLENQRILGHLRLAQLELSDGAPQNVEHPYIRQERGRVESAQKRLDLYFHSRGYEVVQIDPWENPRLDVLSYVREGKTETRWS